MNTKLKSLALIVVTALFLGVNLHANPIALEEVAAPTVIRAVRTLAHASRMGTTVTRTQLTEMLAGNAAAAAAVEGIFGALQGANALSTLKDADFAKLEKLVSDEMMGSELFERWEPLIAGGRELNVETLAAAFTGQTKGVTDVSYEHIDMGNGHALAALTAIKGNDSALNLTAEEATRLGEIHALKEKASKTCGKVCKVDFSAYADNYEYQQWYLLGDSTLALPTQAVSGFDGEYPAQTMIAGLRNASDDIGELFAKLASHGYAANKDITVDDLMALAESGVLTTAEVDRLMSLMSCQATGNAKHTVIQNPMAIAG